MSFLKDMWALESLLYCGDLPNLQTPISRRDTLVCVFGVTARKHQGICLASVLGMIAEMLTRLCSLIMQSLIYVFLKEIFLSCEVNEKIAFLFLFSVCKILQGLEFCFLKRNVQALLHYVSVTVMADLSFSLSVHYLWFTMATVTVITAIADLKISNSRQATDESLRCKPSTSCQEPHEQMSVSRIVMCSEEEQLKKCVSLTWRRAEKLGEWKHLWYVPMDSWSLIQRKKGWKSALLFHTEELGFIWR